MFGAREEEGVEKKVGRDGFIYKEVRRRKKRFVNWNGRLERERERERERNNQRQVWFKESVRVNLLAETTCIKTVQSNVIFFRNCMVGGIGSCHQD